MPKLIMLIGLPGSGKSTWIYERALKNPVMPGSVDDYAIVSSDNILEELAVKEGITYGEAFKKHAKFAMQEMMRRAKRYAKEGSNVIWDQTNMTVKSRRDKLKIFEAYEKSAVVFSIIDPELDRRLKKRELEEGKHIPAYVVKGMARNYQAPTKDEGFTKITTVKD